MNTTTDLLGGASLNKDTYIGYLKIKNGGMKVIPGDIDNEIINKRNIVLEKLEKVLSGGNKLKEKNLEKYFKALGGKYVRNDMCLSGNIAGCKKAKQLSLGGANKLMELSKDKYSKELLEFKFKGAAPVLYEKYINMLNRNNTGGMNRYDINEKGGMDIYNEVGEMNRNIDEGGEINRHSDERGGVNRYSDEREGVNRYGDERGGYKYYDNNMYGGSNEDIGDLEKLRFDIGRYQYFSGGSTNRLCYSDIELNKLRDELDLIRG